LCQQDRRVQHGRLVEIQGDVDELSVKQLRRREKLLRSIRWVFQAQHLPWKFFLAIPSFPNISDTIITKTQVSPPPLSVFQITIRQPSHLIPLPRPRRPIKLAHSHSPEQHADQRPQEEGNEENKENRISLLSVGPSPGHTSHHASLLVNSFLPLRLESGGCSCSESADCFPGASLCFLVVIGDEGSGAPEVVLVLVVGLLVCEAFGVEIV
jgi:hypothetical protein